MIIMMKITTEQTKHLKSQQDRASNGVVVDVTTIDPELASSILHRSQEVAAESGWINRPKKQALIERYVRDMRENRWILTGQSIVIDESGILIDGQHRLEACVDAGIPFVSILVEGVEHRSFELIDQGAPRTFADSLTATHRTYRFIIDSTIRFIFGYEHFGMLCRRRQGFSLSIAEMRKFFDEKKVELLPVIEFCAEISIGNRNICPPALMSALGYIVREQEGFYDFASEVYGKRTDDEGNSIRSIQTEAFVTIASKARTGRGVKITRLMIANYLIEAWNAWFLEKPLTRITGKQQTVIQGSYELSSV